MASINAKLLEQKKSFNYHWIGLEHQQSPVTSCVNAPNNIKQIPFLGGGGGGGGGLEL